MSTNIKTPKSPFGASVCYRRGRQTTSKTPASILKKRVLVDRHVKITPKSKKKLQFSFANSPGSPKQPLHDEDSVNSSLTPGDGGIEDLVKFRRENQELCVSRQNRREQVEASGTPTNDFKGLRRPILATASPKTNSTTIGLEPDGSQHACIHNYRLNDRLFAEPIIADEQGRSLCPICQHPEPSNPSDRSPHFVRVSIPRGIMKSPIRVRPHRKKSFDPSDSFALSKHCLAGYMPPKNDVTSTTVSARQSNFDLMSSIGSAFGTKCHVTVTTRDLQKIAQKERQVAEHRSISFSKRAAFTQSLNSSRLQTTKSPRRIIRKSARS